jgi:hypothetical protein
MGYTEIVMLEFCKPFSVPRSKLVADLLCMAFWLLLAVGLFTAITLDRNLTKRVLWLEILPLIFLVFSITSFLNHIRSPQIKLHEQGLETPGERGPQILEWKNMETVTETREGIKIRGKKQENIFIPRAVTDYEEIRKHIIQMTCRQKAGAKTEAGGNPDPSGS